MISREKFINQSLQLNLFFLRIMKEHSFFLEAAFVPKDENLINQAESFKNEFTQLLSHAISLADGVVPKMVLNSNEIVTKYTMDAEKASQFYTGISIDSSITAREISLSAGMSNSRNTSSLADHIYSLNNDSIKATSMIIRFKTTILNNVLSCRLFTNTYPLLIDHILREAIFFRDLLTKLQNGIELNMKRDVLEQETFWNRIMSEHSFFIRGLLDPSEVDLFDLADKFGKEFEELRKEAVDMTKSSSDLSNLTDTTIEATTKLRDFKAQGTEGLIDCKIKSIIVPLLGDHVLREANHYLNLLETFSTM